MHQRKHRVKVVKSILYKRKDRLHVFNSSRLSKRLPKCRKTFPSFFSVVSWSLPRSSWNCCCLIFVNMYSASCQRKQRRVVKKLRHLITWQFTLQNAKVQISVRRRSKHLRNGLYREREVDTVIQIAEPEEVGEPVGDVKWTELLIAQIQKSQDSDVVLISSVNIAKEVWCAHDSGHNKAQTYCSHADWLF